MNRLLSANDLARVSMRECEGCGEQYTCDDFADINVH